MTKLRTVQVAFRLPRELVKRIDRYVDHMNTVCHGVTASRTDAVRTLLLDALVRQEVPVMPRVPRGALKEFKLEVRDGLVGGNVPMPLPDGNVHLIRRPGSTFDDEASCDVVVESGRATKNRFGKLAAIALPDGCYHFVHDKKHLRDLLAAYPQLRKRSRTSAKGRSR